MTIMIRIWLRFYYERTVYGPDYALKNYDNRRWNLPR